MMLWKQAWEAPSSAVAVADSPEHLLSLAVVLLVALMAGWRSKLPLQMHLLFLYMAVAAVVAVGGWRQRLPLGTQLGIRTCACPGNLSGLCN